MTTLSHSYCAAPVSSTRE